MDIEVGTGRIYKLTETMKLGERTFEATFNWKEQREGYVYAGFTYVNALEGYWGNTRLFEGKKFGITKVEDTGRFIRREVPHWSPRPGDRAYDLMC